MNLLCGALHHSIPIKEQFDVLLKHIRVFIEKPMSNVRVNMKVRRLNPSPKQNTISSWDHNILPLRSHKHRNLQLIQAFIRMSRIPWRHPRDYSRRLFRSPLRTKVPNPIHLPFVDTSPPLLLKCLLLVGDARPLLTCSGAKVAKQFWDISIVHVERNVNLPSILFSYDVTKSSL